MPANKAAAQVVAEANTQVWEEFRKAMEKDFSVCLKDIMANHLDIVRMSWRSGTVPMDFQTSKVVPIFEKRGTVFCGLGEGF